MHISHRLSTCRLPPHSKALADINARPSQGWLGALMSEMQSQGRLKQVRVRLHKTPLTLTDMGRSRMSSTDSSDVKHSSLLTSSIPSY